MPSKSKKNKFSKVILKRYIALSSFVLVLFIVLSSVMLYTQYLFTTNNFYIMEFQRQYGILRVGDYHKLSFKKLETVEGWFKIRNLDDNTEIVIYPNDIIKSKASKYREDELQSENLGYFIEGVTHEITTYVPLDHIKTLTREESNGGMIAILSVSVFVLLLGYGIFIYFSSLWLVKKVTLPIESLKSAISDLRNNKKDILVDDSDVIEFEELSTMFNDLVLELNAKELENQQLQDDRQQILASISHDIKTPIATILGYSSAISDGYITEEKLSSTLKLIQGKSKTVSELVDIMYEYAKLNHSEYHMDLKAVNLVEAVREVCADYYEELEDSEIQLQLDMDLDELIILGDVIHLKRAISNIIRNAIIHGKCHLLKVMLKSDDTATLTIANDGLEIPIVVRERLFNPFVMGDKSRSSGGTGLGLTISKQIIEKHKGTLSLLQEETVFLIKLPLE